MRDVMPEVKAWLDSGDRVAVATVISTWGSAPRPAGSRMAISQSGKIAGSVSGGCLEGEVFEQAQAILQGKPAGLFHYGVSDDLAWTVGLSCGGEVDVLIEPLTEVHRDLIGALEAERPVVLTTDVGEAPGARQLVTAADADVAELLEQEHPVRRDGLFLEPFPRPPELFIFGGSHVAIPLTRLASGLGFRVTVVDARSKFAEAERFPEARKVIHAWPDEVLTAVPMDGSTYIVILTHDPKFDLPALRGVLGKPVGYIGAIGSRKTNQNRFDALRREGFTEEQLGRVHGPIGLDLGGRGAEETALGILAEITAVRFGGSGASMKEVRAASG